MEAAYSDDLARLYCADVLEWALWYKGEIEAGRALPFHAIVTDPPYGLSDPPPIEDVLTAWLAGERFDYGKSGFMGKSWDSLPPGPQIWRALLDITYPGGYLFAFSGTRTADLLGIACRLGGWEPFDRVQNFSWIYASGFPKSHSISKAIDASEVVPCPDCDGEGCETCDGSGEVVGAEREVVGRNLDGSRGSKDKSIYSLGMAGTREHDITAPATPLAQAFDGYGSALKPAHEPVLLFRRPRDGYTFAQCAREFGSGGLWVDRCRVKTDLDADPDTGSAYYAKRKTKYPTDNSDGSGGYGATFVRTAHDRSLNSSGRWPPNCHFSHVPPTGLCPTCNGAGCDDCHGEGVVGGCRRVGSKRVRGSKLDHDCHNSDKIYQWNENIKMHRTGYTDPDGRETVADWECVEGCAVRALDEMAGESKSTRSNRGELVDMRGDNYNRAGGKRIAGSDSVRGLNDSGGPSRFYPCHDWSLEIAERLAGETLCPICLTQTPKHSTMSEMQSGDESCENANGVKKNSSPRDESSGFVPIDAPLPGHQESAGKSESLSTPVSSAEKNSINTQETSENTAQESVLTSPIQKLVQVVKSAGNLCDLCATAFVQNLVLISQEKDPALPLGLGSIQGFKKCTLIHNLVASVEIQEPLDIIQIIQSQKLLSGFVSHVITSYTESKESDLSPSWSRDIGERLANTIPFSYNAKASRGERDAGLASGNILPNAGKRTMSGGLDTRGRPETLVRNFHPTVKSLSLCKWLATLCLPPAQFNPRICVPFAGSGSEVIGAILAGGWTKIHAVEREQEYCEIAAARLAWWTKWAALTNKSDPAEIRALAEAAEAKEAWRGDERQVSMFDLLE